MPLPPRRTPDLTNETVEVSYVKDRQHEGPRKFQETILLPEGFVWKRTGTRERTRRVETRYTLFDESGYMNMREFGRMIERE